jgi:hypothetical protein
MAFVALGVFVIVVALLAWRASRDGESPTGCCAPADPRDDLRMQGAFDDETEA